MTLKRVRRSEFSIRHCCWGHIVCRDGREAIQVMADDLRNYMDNLNAMDLLGEVSTQSVMLRIVARLPMFMRNRWIHEVQHIRKRSKGNTGVRQLVTFVDEATFECNDPVYGRQLDERDNNRRYVTRPWSNRGRGTVFSVSTNESHLHRSATSGPPCSVGSEHHSLFGCQQFKDIQVSLRQQHAMDRRLCLNCSKTGQGTRNCKLNRTCSVDGYGRMRTKLLHPIETEQTETSN